MRKIIQPTETIYTAKEFRYRIVKEKGQTFVLGSISGGPEKILSPGIAKNILESAREKGLRV